MLQKANIFSRFVAGELFVFCRRCVCEGHVTQNEISKSSIVIFARSITCVKHFNLELVFACFMMDKSVVKNEAVGSQLIQSGIAFNDVLAIGSLCDMR